MEVFLMNRLLLSLFFVASATSTSVFCVQPNDTQLTSQQALSAPEVPPVSPAQLAQIASFVMPSIIQKIETGIPQIQYNLATKITARSLLYLGKNWLLGTIAQAPLSLRYLAKSTSMDVIGAFLQEATTAYLKKHNRNSWKWYILTQAGIMLAMNSIDKVTEYMVG